MDVFERAVAFALERHAGMVRKGSDIPYITHPMEAASIVAAMTTDREVLAAAVLHDVVEDTPTTIEEVRARFGDHVAALVASESEDKREGLPPSETWLHRKQETITHMQTKATTEEKMLVIGDKLSNIRGLRRDYDAKGEDIWQRFNVKEKALHGWYYTSILEATQELSHFRTWQEYAALVHSVFDD